MYGGTVVLDSRSDVVPGTLYNEEIAYADQRLKPDPATAAMVKYWLTDCQCRVIDECVQLHGGYGYMQEYPIARMWVDSRIQKIYAGSNEIMKEIVGSSL